MTRKKLCFSLVLCDDVCHSVCVVTDRDGPEAVEFRSGRVNSEDEAGPTVRDDEVGTNATAICFTANQVLLTQRPLFSVLWTVYKRTTRNRC